MELLTASLTASKSSKKNPIPVMGIEPSNDSFIESTEDSAEELSVEAMNEFSGESANTQFYRTAERAYYRSEARGFEPGHEMDDWLAAEAEVLEGEVFQ